MRRAPLVTSGLLATYSASAKNTSINRTSTANPIAQQGRHLTFSRVVAQTWLMILTYTPASKVAAATATTNTATATAAAAAATSGGFVFYLGLADPTMIMLGCGVLARLTTLPISLFGDRCLARLSNAMPELIKAYQAYTAIADHPKSIGWERKVARSKLKRDRQRIFMLHGTGSLRTFMPQIFAGLLAAYMALIPAGIASTAAVVTKPLIPIGALFVDTTAATYNANSVAGAVAMLDGGYALATAITLYNVLSIAHRRMGFNDNLDQRLKLVRKYAVIVAPVGIVTTAYVAPLLLAQAAAIVGASTIPTTFLPAYLAPFWVGMAATSALIQQPVHSLAPLRSALDIPRYPPTHGTYGTQSTGSLIDRSGDDASTQIDEYERTEQWKKHKMLLDFECNMKIYSLLKWLRLETPEDDYERQRERLAFRIAAKKNSDGTINDEKLISQALPKGPGAARESDDENGGKQ